MSKAEPTIQKYMTFQPHSIDVKKTLKEAEKLMRDLKIRHLPVVQNENVRGIITDRDIKTALGISGADASVLRVADVFHEHPYEVEPDAKLHEVCDEMAAHHYGSVIVVQNKKLVGIFTAVDACKALSAILQQRFHE